MLIAINKETDKRWLARNAFNIFEDAHDEEWYCPHCDKEMFFVDAEMRVKHFRHRSECPYETEPESELHLEMKEFFYTHPNAEIEKRFDNQIADVFIPPRFAIECQVSNIPIDKLLDRSYGWGEKNKYVMWVVVGDEYIKYFEGGWFGKNPKWHKTISTMYYGFLHTYYEKNIKIINRKKLSEWNYRNRLHEITGGEHGFQEPKPKWNRCISDPWKPYRLLEKENDGRYLDGREYKIAMMVRK